MSEEDKISFYAGAMGASPDKARAHLIAHNWNLEAALNNEPFISSSRPGPVPRAQTPGPDSRMSRSLVSISSTTRHNSPAPDLQIQRNSSTLSLTAPDDDIARAVALSLKESHPDSVARPLHPEWAHVSSTTQSGSVAASQADQDFEEAIKMSLASQQADEQLEPMEAPKIRQDPRPLAIRSKSPDLTFAALLIQGMFYLPQVRETISNCRLKSRGFGTVQEESEDEVVHALLGCFVCMDLSVFADLRAFETVLDIIAAPQLWDRSPPSSTRKLLNTLIPAIEHVVERQLSSTAKAGTTSNPSRCQIFTFAYAKRNHPTETWNAVVEINPNPELIPSNDLMSTLALRFGDPRHPDDNFVITKHSISIIFQINETLRHTDKRSTLKRFQFPTRLYLDRWMAANSELANTKQAKYIELQAKIQQLRARKATLTRSAGTPSREAFKDIRATIFYYSIAPDHGDVERRENLDGVKGKLERILKYLEETVAQIDRDLERLQLECDVVFDVPELQRLEYTLRVVLMHDGMIGRKHMYSYINDRGTWWKTLDQDVSQVSEDVVLNDPNGLHMGAGPYLLMYSRSIPGEESIVPPPLQWPLNLREGVKQANRKALSDQPADVVAAAYGSKSPPASPLVMELLVSEELEEEEKMDTEGE